MDMSLVASIMASKAGATQAQIGTTVLKSNMDLEKSSVLTLLGAGQQSAPSLSNVGAGVGGNVNISA
jgi:hypothetical protein